MRKYYKLIILLLFFATGYSQEGTSSFYVAKAWVGQDEEWSDVVFRPAIVVSANKEGALKIENNRFLYDLCEGKARFENKAGYNSAELASPKMVKTSTDEKGVLNISYEGMLVLESEGNFYSTTTLYTLLVENDKIVGLKIRTKGNSKEYAFSLVQKV